MTPDSAALDPLCRFAVAEKRRAAHLRPYVVAVLLTGLAIVQQAIVGIDADVSWLLTVSERVLDGQALYVDVFEVNPPASVLIYLPAVIAARLLRLSSESAVTGFVIGLAALAVLQLGRLVAADERVALRRKPLLIGTVIFVLLILPGACFAQREHVALVTLLPMVAVQWLRGNARPVSIVLALAAGAGAGVTMAIKPHFALAVVPVMLATMARRRSLRPAIAPEALAAAAVLIAYGAAVILLFPAFFSRALPLVRTVYLPSGGGWMSVIEAPATAIFAVALFLWLWTARGSLRNSASLPPMLAAIGFFAAALVQGRGYLNHLYPAVALAFLAAAIAQLESNERDRVRLAALGLLGLFALRIFINVAGYPRLTETVREVAPERPGIIVAGSNLSIGHPLTRQVGGRWAGRRASLWASGTANELLLANPDPATRARLRAYQAEDRRIFVEDVQRRRPDVVLVPGADGLRFIRTNPEVARALAGYRRVAEAEGVHVLLRSGSGR